MGLILCFLYPPSPWLDRVDRLTAEVDVHQRPHVVDHVDPLKRGGADTPANMQWQTKSEAKAKDKWE
jgi:hypothetical protein